MHHSISNFASLATTKAREDALSIIEKGSEAIDTNLLIKQNVSLIDDILSIRNHKYYLRDFNRVFVFGIGKASCHAVLEIENILGEKINGGIVLDKKVSSCKFVDVYKGSHPLPSSYNVEVTQKMIKLAESLTEKDLVIAIVSGGGSALLCYPLSECEQGSKLYSTLLKAGGNIKELNILRKHISSVKGGGLAKFLYPATVASLVFCDVPGNHFKEVASGPTYFDNSTISDAQNLMKKYNITESFSFIETPKEDKIFEKVTNIPFVSNEEAIKAMSMEAKLRGYEVVDLGDEIYDSPDVFLKKAKSVLKNKTIVLAGGELSIALKKDGGLGGRNLYVASEFLNMIEENDLFIAFASDGIDNKSVAAGAIVDWETKSKIQNSGLNANAFHSENKDSELFEEIGQVIITGETGSNVSDLYLMMRN